MTGDIQRITVEAFSSVRIISESGLRFKPGTIFNIKKGTELFVRITDPRLCGIEAETVRNQRVERRKLFGFFPAYSV